MFQLLLLRAIVRRDAAAVRRDMASDLRRNRARTVQGSCNNRTIVPEYQVPVIDNSMFPGVFNMSSLMEFLGPFATTRNQSATHFGHDFTVEQVGYLINDSVAYVPPTLKKSPFLLAVFAFQPIMIKIILGLSVLLRTTPINKAST